MKFNSKYEWLLDENPSEAARIRKQFLKEQEDCEDLKQKISAERLTASWEEKHKDRS